MVYIIKLFVVKGVDIKEFSYLLKTYTDILRLAVELSDGDTSLSQKTRFKNFTRRERKILLQLFDNCKVNLEDMLRHRQMYLRLGEKIHPGEYREKYPHQFSCTSCTARKLFTFIMKWPIISTMATEKYRQPFV